MTSASRSGSTLVDPDEGPERIDCRNLPTEELVRLLQPMCDVGYVANVTLRGGFNSAVVLVGVSSTALIVDRWDEVTGQPVGDPGTISIGELVEISIP